MPNAFLKTKWFGKIGLNLKCQQLLNLAILLIQTKTLRDPTFPNNQPSSEANKFALPYLNICNHF